MLRTLQAWLELARPLNAAMAVGGVALGAYLAAGASALAGATGQGVGLAALAATLVGAGANALNDRLDVATDRVNRPRRPIPSGRATEAQATGLWAACSGGAVALAALVSPWHAAVAGASVAVLVVYSRWLKGTPLVGNAVVAVVIGFGLVFGGEAAGGGRLPMLAAVFAFLTTLAREMVKDVEDVAGDAAAGLRTAPVLWGVRTVASMALALIAGVLAALPLPVLAGWVQPPFLLAALGVGVALVQAATDLLPRAAPSSPRRASAWLKGAMLLGMLALAMGR